MLAAVVAGSGVAALDATVVNVALPAIGEDLGVGVAGLQWTLDGYLLTLAALILIGGSLGDQFGRRRVFTIGVTWFALASLLCGLAPNITVLVLARALQGVGGALLTPGSLAIVQSTFHPDDRGRAIGAWSGLGGLATAIGPFAGGYLIGAVSWRAIFLLNLPLAAAVVLIARRHVPESHDSHASHRVDVGGAVLGALGLAGVTAALIEGPSRGGPLPWVAGVLGVLALVGFLVWEARIEHPMLPLDLFRSRQFSGANLVTFALYAGLSGVFFLLAVVLQSALGYSPLEAGASLLPVTALMLVGSPLAGQLAQKIGPRVPMTVGPAVAAVGILLFRRIDEGATYVGVVLPAVVVFACGLALTVAPLTAAALGAADASRAGVASGVNNAVARVAGLLSVATLPLAAGLSGAVYDDPPALLGGFHRAVAIIATLVATSAVIAWATIRRPPGPPPAETAAPPFHCAVDAPPPLPQQV